MNLAHWNNTLWLAEPSRLQRHAAQAASYGACYTARQIAVARKRARQEAEALHEQSYVSGGVDHLEEKAEVKAIRATKGKVGVIPIYGPVAQRMSSELMKSGGTSLEFVGNALDSLIGNPAIGAVVLRFDCPGGECYGTEELATRIFKARDQKPIYAMIDSMACSAGFWLATACSMVISTPGGDTGSLGVYVLHVDESQALEFEGVKVTPVHAGKHKVEFAPFSPLSDEAKAELQGRVDAIYDKFVANVAKHRGTSKDDVLKNYGQGRVLSAKQAIDVGAIDRILSFEELINKLTGNVVNSGGSAKAELMPNSPTAEVLWARELEHRRKRERQLS